MPEQDSHMCFLNIFEDSGQLFCCNTSLISALHAGILTKGQVTSRGHQGATLLELHIKYNRKSSAQFSHLSSPMSVCVSQQPWSKGEISKGRQLCIAVKLSVYSRYNCIIKFRRSVFSNVHPYFAFCACFCNSVDSTDSCCSLGYEMSVCYSKER